MKSFLRCTQPIVCLLALWLPTAKARAAQGEVSYEFFYASLQASGTWLESANYGYVWQPRIAVDKFDWRPYADGYWSHTDQGWTWISYEEFGWATYHYGRWARLSDIGWIWVPGFEWAPAWVSWRASPGLTGRNVPPSTRTVPDAVGVEPEEVVGWAPLPPEAAFNPARGFSPQVDLAFQLGPDIYNFVPARHFGEIVLRPWIFRAAANAGLMASTWNCTNIIFRPNPGFIWSGGPSFWVLRATAQIPVAQLHLESRYVASTGPWENLANRVESDVFLVTAPIVIPPQGQASGSIGLPVGPSTTPPTLGGPLIPARSIEHGWIETPRDSPAVAELRESIKRDAADAPQMPVPPAGSPAAANVIRIAPPKPAPAEPAPASTARRTTSKSKAGEKTATPSPAESPVPKSPKGRSKTLPPPSAGDEPAPQPASPRAPGAK